MTHMIPKNELSDKNHNEQFSTADIKCQNLEIVKNNEQIQKLRKDIAYAAAKEGWQKWIANKEAKIKELLEANEAYENEAFNQLVLNKLNILADDLINQPLYSLGATMGRWLKAVFTTTKYILISIPVGVIVGLSLAVALHLLLGAGTKPINLTAFYAVFSLIGIIGCGMFVVIKQVERGIYPSFRENKRKFIAIEKYKEIHHKYHSERQKRKQVEEYRKWEMQKNEEATRKEYWQKLSGEAFETELKKMLRQIGYKNFNSYGHPNKPDGGVDFYVQDPSGNKCVIQCKAHKKPVTESHVRDLLGVLAASEGKASYAVMASLGGLTKPAQRFADRNGIQVWTIEEVVKMSALSLSLKSELSE